MATLSAFVAEKTGLIRLMSSLEGEEKQVCNVVDYPLRKRRKDAAGLGGDRQPHLHVPDLPGGYELAVNLVGLQFRLVSVRHDHGPQQELGRAGVELKAPLKQVLVQQPYVGTLLRLGQLLQIDSKMRHALNPSTWTVAGHFCRAEAHLRFRLPFLQQLLAPLPPLVLVLLQLLDQPLQLPQRSQPPLIPPDAG